MRFFRLRWPLVLYLFCAAAMVATVHAPLLDSFFVEDDARNLYVGSRVGNWLALFYNREVALEANNYFYRPLSYVSLWLDGWLFGVNPLGYHLHALALLLAAGLLLVALIRQLSKDSLWAWLAGGLVVLSPVATATAAWLSAAHLDLLGGVLYLGSLLAFAQHRQDGSRGWYLVSLALAAAGMFSKETTLTLPLVLLIGDRIIGGTQRARTWSFLPFFGMLAVYLTLRTYMLDGLGGYPHLPVTASAYLDRLWRLPLLLISEMRPLFPIATPAAGLAALALGAYLLVRSPRRLLGHVAIFLLLLAPAVPVLGTAVSGPRNLFIAALAVAVALADALRMMLRSSSGGMRIPAVLLAMVMAFSMIANSWELAQRHVARSQSARRASMAAWQTLQSAQPATKLFFVYPGSPWALTSVLLLMSNGRPPKPFSVLRPATYLASWGLAERLSAGESVRVFAYDESTGEWNDKTDRASEEIQAHMAMRRSPPPVLTAHTQRFRLTLQWEGSMKSQPVHLYVGKGDRGIYSEEAPGYLRESISALRSPGQYEFAVAYQDSSGVESRLAITSLRIETGRAGGHPLIPDHFL